MTKKAKYTTNIECEPTVAERVQESQEDFLEALHEALDGNILNRMAAIAEKNPAERVPHPNQIDGGPAITEAVGELLELAKDETGREALIIVLVAQLVHGSIREYHRSISVAQALALVMNDGAEALAEEADEAGQDKVELTDATAELVDRLASVAADSARAGLRTHHGDMPQNVINSLLTTDEEGKTLADQIELADEAPIEGFSSQMATRKTPTIH